MSKQPTRANGASTKRLAEDGGASTLSKTLHSLSLQQGPRARSLADPSSDICPVCKSSRYLNPNMKFRVNPECYHKMCESCVDRIFSHGPAPCPIAGCARTLRRNKFREQTFEDLKIEREVDIRKRVMSAMTKQEADFETLRDYNDYLEQVEEITWNLILKVDVELTESRLRRWEEHQKAELNLAPSRREPESLPTDHPTLKKGVVQRKAPSASSGSMLDTSANKDDKDTGFTFRGLKKRVAPPKEAPFDPFDGWEITPQYFVQQDDYEVDWYQTFKKDPAHLVAMWDVRDYASRTLREAFGGFGIFIEDEINARAIPSMNAGIGTEQAAVAAVMDVNMEDVF
ncbi:CDK-activating kinase assembly factor [Cucurbitaria berberidis CBS 394.84]|uniref:RNA polymerase II transcription factor B subunit 3 n=1 Tax=Cucurbitaria berberidis CBS 394.84 TaxID=1168544 RepID=A0A9P4GS32_9PLEO|nr:CDK-activating kinase assembly factor [Cucurbitaria berberidis CBS 394.84]KAF1850302.1 CDK-activating kinase assembly factor [Cucurbitaria berberidis CBS 394.84]